MKPTNRQKNTKAKPQTIVKPATQTERKVPVSNNAVKKESWHKRLINRFPKSTLAVKTMIVVGTGVAAACYTDSKHYFDPKMTFHERYVADAFNKFCKNDTVDILILGNSIAGAGINNHMLSNALGANSFNYFTSCSNMMDQYFTLRDVLTKTTPKVVIIEAYSIGDILKNNKLYMKKSLSFMQRSDVGEKLKSMPYLFTIDDYWQAWSTTIRNHEFIFRDTALINANIAGYKYRLKSTYLGDTNFDVACLSDSMLQKYDSLGPLIDGDKVKLREFDFEYAHKIDALCKENGITLLYLSLPIFYKNIRNYDTWKQKESVLINSTNSPWLDMNDNYDTLVYSSKAYENHYMENLHLVYAGACHATHQLASWMRDSLKLDLPKRDTSKHWHDIFYGSEGYFYNYPPREKDTANVNLGMDLDFGKLKIQNAMLNIQEKSNLLILKFEKDSLLNNVKKITLIVKGDHQGKEILAQIDIYRFEAYGPQKYDVYQVPLIKEFMPKQIMKISF